MVFFCFSLQWWQFLQVYSECDWAGLANLQLSAKRCQPVRSCYGGCCFSCHWFALEAVQIAISTLLSAGSSAKFVCCWCLCLHYVLISCWDCNSATCQHLASCFSSSLSAESEWSHVFWKKYQHHGRGYFLCVRPCGWKDKSMISEMLELGQVLELSTVTLLRCFFGLFSGERDPCLGTGLLYDVVLLWLEFSRSLSMNDIFALSRQFLFGLAIRQQGRTEPHKPGSLRSINHGNWSSACSCVSPGK